MADSHVQVPVDDAGKKLQTFLNTIGLHDVHAEAVTLVDSLGNVIDKAEDAAHGSGDKGVMLLAVRQDDALSLVSTDGDYSALTVSEHGCLNVDPQHYKEIADTDAVGTWTVLGNDTLNLATSTNHVFGTNSLEFDKVNGAANTVFAAIQKTLTSINVNKYMEEGGGFLLASYNLPDLTNIDYVFLRLGTDNANYNEWRVTVDDSFAAGWDNVRYAITRPDSAGSTGNGWDSSAVTYVCIGVAFDLEANTLADIKVDALFCNSGLQTSADITSQVTSSVSSPNVIVRAWGNAVDTNQGNAGNNTLRVAIADDDTNLEGITKDEDVLHQTGDTGVMMLGVRNDTPTSLVNVDLDYTPIAVDEYGRPKTIVSSETEGSLDHGSNLDIDLAAEQITAISFAAKHGVLLKADINNDGILYVGNSDVTDGDTAATDGIPLSAGEWVVMPVNNPNLLYAIGSAVNQKIYWMAV